MNSQNFLQVTQEMLLDLTRKYSSFIGLFRHVILENIPISHSRLFDTFSQHSSTTFYKTETLEQELLTFATELESSSSIANSLILAERVYYTLFDWFGKEEYRLKIDQLENRDFEEACQRQQQQHMQQNQPIQLLLNQNHPKQVVKCPMKLALSSANNSDRYGASKLEGSKVLNMAVNVLGDSSFFQNEMESPITGEVELVMNSNEKPFLEIQAYHDMTGQFTWHKLTITEDNSQELLCYDAQKKNPFGNSDDLFGFYKYALFFSGIISCNENQISSEHTAQYWQEYLTFTNNQSIKLTFVNKGNARAGFSSSSSVMTSLLALLYSISGQKEKLNSVYDLALLAENKLGLRSGWNDTYCLMPGFHNFETEPTTELPKPIMKNKFEHVNKANFEQTIVLVHTGIQRKASSRMNRRHEIYLSKDEQLYPVLLESVEIHDWIVQSLEEQNYELLGKYMTRYMQCRVAFDSLATNSYLDYFFETLLRDKMIHGGMLSGAMGGGIAILVLTEEAKHNKSVLQKTLLKLNQHTFENGQQPFQNSLFGTIPYQINEKGMHLLFVL